MGSQEGGQERLFYSFKLDDHIPSSHLLHFASISLPSTATLAAHRSILC